MTIVKREMEVPFTAAQMYKLVNDIKSYPQFLPWCSDSEIISQDEDEIKATLYVRKGAIQKSFSTCNRLQHNKMIEVKLINGPFKQLEGFWAFEDIGENKSTVTLNLDFEFSSKLLAVAFGKVFEHIATTFVDCFCNRAYEVYEQD